MSKDIVKRLEAWEHGDHWPRDQSLDDDLADAALAIVSLRAALREALDGWARWAYPRADEHGSDGVRIAELRKFLDDK